MGILYVGVTGRTPLGELWVASDAYGLVAVEFKMSQRSFEGFLRRRFKGTVEYAPKRVAQAIRQLEEYLKGRRRHFTVPINWSIFTEFQREALQATFAIPYGETRTYGEIAARMGNPRAARAVGRAEATNPMPLVIPCHRLVGADGGLHGYGGRGGLRTKAWLQKLEKTGK